MNKKLILITALILVSFAGFAHAKSSSGKKEYPKKFLGTWELTSFVRITYEGKEIPWCTDPKGLLTYAKDGYMSASINCSSDTPSDAPSRMYNNMLLYAGTYEMKSEATISHHVLNSSQQDLIGKDLIRRVEKVDRENLILTGEAPNHTGSFRIAWKRAK